MPRYKLTIEFAGTKYSGWQKQKNARTVQGEIESAIEGFTRDKTFEFMGSGRTDAGVHALRQVAHLDVRKALPAESLRRGINDLLPADIHVLAVDSVPHRFHARHSAIARSYLYQVSRRRSAFAKPYVWWVKDPLDLTRMRTAAAIFAGLHDFRAFSDDDPSDKSTKVLLDEVTLVEDGALVLIRVAGSHFLWKMVRRMVGVLAAVGTGDLDRGDIEHLLAGEGGDVVAQLTAPAAGLFLEHVLYPGDAWPRPIVAAMPVR